MNGCTCMACCEKHCICDDADWTPKEVLSLRAKLSRLEYVHEEAMKMWEQEDAEITCLRAENKQLREALEELLYAHTDKAVAMATAALNNQPGATNP